MKLWGTNMKSPSIKRMHTISVVWGIILVLMVSGLTAIGFVYKYQSKPYKELEETLKQSAMKYVDKKALLSDSDLKISVGELLQEEMIESTNVKEKPCEGYVLVKKVREHYEYESYIKCEKYKTKGYDKH